MKKDLPIYDIIINDDTQGVGMISLVDDPAIKVNWIKLAKQQECPDCDEVALSEGDACWEGYVQVGTKIVDGREVPNCVPVKDGEPKPQRKGLSSQRSISFKSDKEKQLLYGPFLIPNMLIYRFDETNGEYYVRFSKEEIEKIATKFNEDLNNKNINFMHTNETVNAFVASNWIIEGEQDKSKNLGFDLPEGTWFGSVKIKDNQFWKDKVKNEEVKGFSVEILADLELSLKNKEKQMEKEIKLGQAKLKDGITVYWDGEFGMGTAIFIDEALTQPAPDADHVLEDGTIVTTVDGKVTEIEVSSIEEDLEVAPTATAAALTSDEVSQMIDARFAELMDEITLLKSSLEEKDKSLNQYKAQIEEKFSTTPAVSSVSKKVEQKLESNFSKAEARIKEFAKTHIVKQK